MTFGWLRPVGKWMLQLVVKELLEEIARPDAPRPRKSG